jgi:predicted phage gp36 major capsid-like protein
MAEKQCEGPTKCGWVESERILAKTFDAWRAEFRAILEDHRRDIQSRLETIERRIEQKSDRENVDLIVHGINDEFQRHADEIRSLRTGLEGKVGVETIWKVAGLVIALGGILSGIISTVVSYLGR